MKDKKNLIYKWFCKGNVKNKAFNQSTKSKQFKSWEYNADDHSEPLQEEEDVKIDD